MIENPKKNLASSLASNAMTTNDFFNFWKHIYINRKYWEECDIILTCPLMHQGAIKAFGEKKLFLLKNFSQFFEFYNQYEARKMKSIGIISVDIINELIKESDWLIKLMQLCSMRMVLAIRYDKVLLDSKSCLSFLHHMGFYNVLTLLNQDNMSYLSQEISADGTYGSYFYYSYLPGISTVDNPFITHVACRLPYTDWAKNSWLNVLGHIEYLKNLCVSGLPEQLGISIKQIDKKNELFSTINTTIIKATFYWDSNFTNGDISLVSSHHGPTDSNMYALMFRGDNWTNLSILKSDANCQWISMAAKKIDASSYTVNAEGKYKISFWLKTTPQYLIAGVGEKTILKVEDNTIPRNHLMGLRFYSDKVFVSDIQTQYLKEDDEKL